MILRRLSLWGITRYDVQVDLDFAALGPGVIAFAGENGVGKTTLMECSGPGALFRELPTRDPDELHASTRPGGGWLQLDFDLGADSYTARIEVDKRGQQQAYLVRNGVPVVSGKVRDFDKEIADLIGAADAFYASVFGLQGGGGKIASLTVGDRKAIFRWFLGLDRIAKLRDAAQKRLALLDGKEVDRLAGEVQRVREEIADLDGRALPGLQDDLAGAKSAAEAAQAAREAAADAIALAERRQAALRDLDRLARDEAVKTQAAKDKLAALDRAKAAAPADPGPEPTDPAEARAELAAAQEAVREADRLDTEAKRLQQLAVQAKADTDRAARAAGLLGTVPCGGADGFEGCQFLKDAVQARGQLAKLQLQLKNAEAAAAAAVETARVARAAAPALTTQATLARTVRDAEMAARSWQTARAAADRYAATLASADAAYKAAAQAAITARKALKAAPPAPDAPDVDVRALNAAVATTQQDVQDATRDLAHAQGQLEAKRTQLRQTERKLAEAQDRAADAPALQFLVRALGPDGIQALEIDAAGPQVAGMANDLLLACYGPRFTVEIRTQRAMKSKEGHEEDLEIVVLDAQEGRSGPLGSLSGGEQVIVDEAVRTALAMFAARRLEAPIRTLWRDETAGALTPENARRYVQMLRRAAEIGGFHQILFVAHDPDVIASADAVVRVQGDGALAIEVP